VVPDLGGGVGNVSRRLRKPPIWSSRRTGCVRCCRRRLRALDRGAKLKVYAEHRVGFAWFVEPLEKLVEVLELDGPTYRIVQTAEGDTRVRLRPFDAIEFPLGALWVR
jgi:hypothetical protein